LLEGGLAFAPLYMIDIDGTPIWEPWLMGILGAVRLRPEQFERLIASCNTRFARSSRVS
jgi:hypothetical protein